MLSFLYQIVTTFWHDHGIRPNVVYLNRAHFRALAAELPGYVGHDAIARFLDMAIVVTGEMTHPDVAWVTGAARRAATSG